LGRRSYDSDTTIETLGCDLNLLLEPLLATLAEEADAGGIPAPGPGPTAGSIDTTESSFTRGIERQVWRVEPVQAAIRLHKVPLLDYRMVLSK
jgi:hypothetical protein